MDVSNLSSDKKEKIKSYEKYLKKGPYHYFVKENKKSYNNDNKEMSKAWKNLSFDNYFKYLKIALNTKKNLKEEPKYDKDLKKYITTKTTKFLQPYEGKTILTNRGYEICKKIYPDQYIEKLRDGLTVKPKAAKGYGKEPEAYNICREDDDTIYIPRYYGQRHLDFTKIPNKLSKGIDINVKFNEKRILRDYQAEIIKRLTYKLKTVGGSILQIPCGFGKTCCALKMIHVLQKKTLVLLHAEHLLNQWKERINEFLPGATVGRIQGSIVDVEGKDIVIGMIQSVCKKDYKDSLFDQFGLVISDECHRTGAKEFCKALRRSAAYYTLGLTATPNRKDGLTKVFKWYLGEILDISDMKHIFKKYKYNVTVQAIYYVSENYEEKMLYTGGYNIAKMMGQIVDERKRNKKIVNMAREMVLKNKRQVLIISHRIAHIKMLEKMIKDKNTLEEMVTTGLFIGGMKREELALTETKNVIIGSFKMIEEGADIKTLDTIILATPKGDVEQATGRIMRQKNPNDPLIVDFIDLFSTFINQSFKRMNYYRKKGYNLAGYRNSIQDDSKKNQKIINEINEVDAFADDSD